MMIDEEGLGNNIDKENSSIYTVGEHGFLLCDAPPLSTLGSHQLSRGNPRASRLFP
jgi:hypothetical protein